MIFSVFPRINSNMQNLCCFFFKIFFVKAHIYIAKFYVVRNLNYNNLTGVITALLVGLNKIRSTTGNTCGIHTFYWFFSYFISIWSRDTCCRGENIKGKSECDMNTSNQLKNQRSSCSPISVPHWNLYRKEYIWQMQLSSDKMLFKFFCLWYAES